MRIRDWFRRSEKRAGYTDSFVSALLSVASGENIQGAGQTAALEACAALYASCFAAARVEGDAVAVSALGPYCRASIARRMIARGEFLGLIEVGGSVVKLLEAVSRDVRGLTPDPAGWVYRLYIYGPSGARTRVVPAAGVVHARYADDPAQPGCGIGPLAWAATTGSLAGRVEAMLNNEAGAPSAQLLPVPADGGDGSDTDPLVKLKQDLATAKGGNVLVETTAAGWGQGMSGAPRQDWEQRRIGASWPDVLRSTRRDVAEAVATACNVPFVLLDPQAEGTSQREGLRRFAHLSVEPLARVVEEELEMKLGRVRFDFGPLMASDIAGKARAVRGLVDAGIPLAEAVAVTGLMAEG